MRAIVIVGLAGCGFESPAAPRDASMDDADPSIFDASTDDADPSIFDPTTCPNSYTIPGLTSRYRIIIDGHEAWEQAADCADDIAGTTHLAVLDSTAELVAIQSAVDLSSAGIAGNQLWIGAVQLRDQLSPGAGWLGFDGNPLISNVFRNPPEPNDGNNSEDNDEQFARITKTQTQLTDDAGGGSFGAVCECDGRAVPMNVTDAVTASML